MDSQSEGMSRADIFQELKAARRHGELAAWLYGVFFLSLLPRLRGFVGLRFIGLIFKGFSIGPGARCWRAPLVFMEHASKITIGKGFSSTSDKRRAGIAIFSPCKLRTMSGAHLLIGDNVALNGTTITCRQRVEIGDGTMVAANVVIVDSDFHVLWPPENRAFAPLEHGDEPVFIGRNVWIGMGSIVLKGSRIGDNSIIGAGSVVIGEIPPNVVAAGVPAKVKYQIGEAPEGIRQ